MPQKFVNLENLTSFWGNAKEYIGNEKKEIEDQLYNWQKTEKAPVVQCEPVPNSDLHPIVDFMFTETPPAEGEKSPTNSSTITGVDSIMVTKTGKNLIPMMSSGTATSNGITFTVNSNGMVTVNGTASGASTFVVYQRLFLFAGQYCISGCPVGGSTGTYSLAAHRWGGSANPDTGSGKTFTVSEDGEYQIYITFASGITASNLVFRPQLELGSVVTAYEPPSPTTATINLGETRYGGSIDLATGKMTVTWGAKIIKGTETFAKDTTYSTDSVNVFTSSLELPQGVMSSNPTINDRFCSHFSWSLKTVAGSYFTWGAATNSVFRVSATDYSDTSAFKTWLASEYSAGHPVVLGFLLNNPYIVQLTPTQIKSLTSLEGTSKRINTIYTDADSIQVEYQKYVGIDSTFDSNSVNAIQNKVVNNALNTKVSLTGDETIAGSKTFSSPINGSITGDAGTVAGHIVSKDVPVNAAFTDTTYEPATQSTAGLMSASDKTKLDAVGSVFTFKGSIIDDTYLPASDNVSGDAYLAEDTGHVHVYDGSSFIDIGVWAGIPSATDAQIDALFED